MSLQKFLEWKNENRKRKYLCYFGAYTVVFAVLVLFWMRWVLVYGDVLLGDADGTMQFFPGVVYFGRYIREAVSGFFATGHLSLPAWDLHIGLGDDVWGALNQYAFGDVLDLVYVFVPEKCVSTVYSVLAILRLYLAGIAFSCFGLYKKKPHFYVLCGAVFYTFNYWSLTMCYWYGYFLNALIYLPLLVIAMERMFEKKKKAMFTILTALSLLSSFYFFYMITLGLLVYGILYCVRRYRGEGFWKKSLLALWYCVFGYIKAILAVAPVMIPVVASFVGSYRSGEAGLQNVWLYPFGVWLKRLTSIFSYAAGPHQAILGMGGIALAVIAVACVCRRHRMILWGVVAALAAYSFPLFSFLMNAGASDLGRWNFLLLFFGAAALLYVLPDILNMNPKAKRLYLILAAAYVGVLSCFRYASDAGSLFIVGFSLFVGAVVLFVMIPGEKRYHGKLGMLTAFLVVDVIINSAGYTALYKSIPNLFSSEEAQAYSRPITTRVSREDLQVHGYRVDTQNKMGTLASINYGWTEKLPTLTAYYSMLGGNVTEFSGMIGNTRENSAVIVQDYDDRTVLNQLMGVKYLFADSGQEPKRSIPYGYIELQEQSYIDELGREQVFSVYENTYAMPILYGYDSCITKETWESLPMNQREQALLQGAVVEDAEGFPAAQLVMTDTVLLGQKELEQQLAEKSNSILVDENGDIVVLRPNANVYVSCQLPAGAESYLEVANLTFDSPDNAFYERYKDFYSREEEKKNVSGYGLWGPAEAERVNLTVETSQIQTVMRHNTESHMYHSFDSVLMNLGYREQAETWFRLTLDNVGTYHFENLRVIAQPIEAQTYGERVAARKDIAVKKLKIGGDKISARITAKDSRIVCVAVPYSTGWKAYVDGEETPVEKINGMFMGLRVEPGKHKLLLKYETPGRRAGMAASGVYWGLSLICFGLRWLWRRRKIKQEIV